jgi:hypothetical protein
LEKFEPWIGKLDERTTPITPNYQKLLDEDNGEPMDQNFPYRQLVGSLIYLMTCTRFDIAVAVSVVSKYLDKPKQIHANMVKRIFWYLRGTQNHHLVYSMTKDSKITGWVDASYANDLNCKSRSGYAFQYGKSLVSWKSMTQPVVALSTAESEFIALTPAVQEAIWMTNFFKSLGYNPGVPTLMEDNQSCISISENPQHHQKTKHIQVRWNWIKEQLSEGAFQLKYCPTKLQLGDVFTKGLHGPNLKQARTNLGLRTSISDGELNLTLEALLAAYQF